MRTEREIVDYVSKQPWGAELCVAAFKQRVSFDLSKNIINQIDWTVLSHSEAYWKDIADQYNRWFTANKPTSWLDYCSNSDVSELFYINDCCQIKPFVKSFLDPQFDINVMSESLCRAFLALMKLKQLRDEWCQGFNYFPYKILYSSSGYFVYHSVDYKQCLFGLSFPTEELANEFLECFKNDLLIAQPLL